MKLRYALILTCATITGAALAAVPSSGSAPATATAASAAADYSSPTAAAKTYLRALNVGDSKAVHDAMVVPTGHEAEVDAFVSLTIAQHWLQDAAVTKFKNDGDKVFLGDPKTRVSLAAQIKTLEEQKPEISGDAATISMPPVESEKEAQKVTLKKTADGWKLDAMVLYSLDSDKTALRAALAKKLATVTEVTTKEITSGKFSSATEAYQEYWLRMKEASQGSAATARATAPATPAAPAGAPATKQ